jgi:hypothetical protein
VKWIEVTGSGLITDFSEYSNDTSRNTKSVLTRCQLSREIAYHTSCSEMINNTGESWLKINPLKTKLICFIQGLSAYRAVNTLHFGYKNQSLNVL